MFVGIEFDDCVVVVLDLFVVVFCGGDDVGVEFFVVDDVCD